MLRQREQYFYFMHMRFDIAKAQQMIAENIEDMPIVTIDVEEVYNSFLAGHDHKPGEKLLVSLISIAIDKEHAMSDAIDLRVPLIAGKVAFNPYVPLEGDTAPENMLLDGWHRVYRAHHEGIETLEAYMFEPEQVFEFMYNPAAGRPTFIKPTQAEFICPACKHGTYVDMEDIDEYIYGIHTCRYCNEPLDIQRDPVDWEW